MSFRHFFSRSISCPFLFTLLLLVGAAPLLGMGGNDNNAPASSNNPNGHVPLMSFRKYMEDAGHPIGSPQITTDSNKKTDTYSIDFNGATIEEMQLALESAPDLAKQIVRHLKNIHFLNDSSFRVSIFWGAPGTGKTTTALGIAYEMNKKHNWKHIFISNGSLVKTNRNATAEALQQILKAIETDTSPTILIMDEMNELLENTESENHDTSVTSKVLWDFLDKQRGNHNFFCIGTMNRIDKLAEPFQDRYSSRCIEFLAPADTMFRNTLFRRNLSDDYTHLHQQITHAELNNLLQPIINCSGRNLREISLLCRAMCRREDSESTDMIIKIDHIRLAISEFVRVRVRMRYGQPRENDKEQRERHHIEQLAQAREQFQAQQRLQTINFVQTIRAQAFTSTNNFSLGGGVSTGGEAGAGACGNASIGNIGFKENLLNYVLTTEQLEINDEIERQSEPRATTIVGSIKNRVVGLFTRKKG